METPDGKTKALAGGQREVDQAPEDSMADWFNRGANDIQ